MTDALPSSDATLAELLAARARHASDLRLWLDVGVGVLVAAAVVLWRPRGWLLLVSAALCFAAFGVWGMTDRAFGVSPRPVLRALRVVAAAVGTLAALVLAGGIVALGVGRVIS